MEALNQSLDEQRVKRDVAMAQAGVPRGAGMGYGGCGGGGNHRGGGHMGNGSLVKDLMPDDAIRFRPADYLSSGFQKVLAVGCQ